MSTDDPRIDALLGRLTLHQKVGQMVLAEVGTPVVPAAQSPIDAPDIGQFAIGGGLLLGPIGERLGALNGRTVAQAWRDYLAPYAGSADDGPAGIPLLIGIDAVHGHGYFDGPSTIFPHNIGLGATRDPELVQAIASATAAEVAATGVHWTFSPTLAVARDLRWGRVYEAFGETTELQRLFAAPYIHGMQGTKAPYRVAATGKHFVGEGETTGGKDRGDSTWTEAELRERHLPGYVDAIGAGVQVMMSSFHSWNHAQVHGHRWLLTTLLKEELGFDGFVVSDWRGAVESGVAFADSINAGVDMHMLPDPLEGGPTWRDFITEVEAAVSDGRIAQERIDDAVRRILRVKVRLGLFDGAQPPPGEVGTDAHHALARRAVRQSLVVLKNDGVLPLSREQRVVLVGSHADHAGLQSGGWTKGWQGTDARTFEGATTILEGMRAVCGDPAHVLHDPEGTGLDADVAVIVVGESPYSEFLGDKSAEELVLTDAQRACFATYTARGIPVVFVLISGRPLLVGSEVAQSNAFVAAWLPGSEGAGVADVLYGDHPPTGRLPVTWPASAEQVTLNVGDQPYEPLFPYGAGLSYPA